MSDFTPDDWIKIGSALIGTWWFSRFMFLFVIGLFGTDLNEHTININVTGMVKDDD